MKLNTSQLKAAHHLSGPMMVLAGPGSGKTSVIVSRTEYLISSGEAEPSHILVVTFSRAAAREMRERFLARIGSRQTQVTFGTFHGIFYGILKAAYHLGPGNILSEGEKFEILKEIAMNRSPDLATEGDFLEDLSREIGTVKGNRIDIEHYYSATCSDEVFKAIFRDYCEIKNNRRKLDFDDMILYCYELFQKRPDILAAWQKKFTYILVDEFQDVSSLQYDVIRMLAAPENNLFVVGDDDQSIYRFRGARPEIMLNFPKDYKDAGRILLDTNYRCTGNVLDAALNVIGHNKARFDKKLQTVNEPGTPVKTLTFDSPPEEYAYVVRKAQKLAENGGKYSDMAVLFRTNREAEGLVQKLMEFQIPFVMKEQLPNIFNHFICKDMLAYMHLAAGEKDRKYFLQVMNRPNRYISREAASARDVGIRSLLAYYSDKDWMVDRLVTMQNHLKIIKKLNPYAAVNFIRKAVGYEDYLQDYAAYRKINADELIETLDEIHESTKGKNSLEEWEAHIEEYAKMLEEQAQKQDEQPEGVVISTLHRVKGLEFPNVFILNVNEGSIPYRKAVLPEAIEEERRLFYVGMTRASKELTLCHVNRQFEKTREPSRFLEETGLMGQQSRRKERSLSWKESSTIRY